MDDPMLLLDVVILGYGIYILCGAIKMRKDKQPPKWLISADERMRMRYPKKFCECIAKKTIIFGVICVAYGAFTLLESFYLDTMAAELISLAVFLAVLVWFMRELRKAKKECI